MTRNQESHGRLGPEERLLTASGLTKMQSGRSCLRPAEMGAKKAGGVRRLLLEEGLPRSLQESIVWC